MKSKIKAMVIIALTAVVVLAMIACDDKKDVDTSEYYVNAPTGIVATKLSNSNTPHMERSIRSRTL
jgi:uncharacterized lipoprotein YehR (DUF1307 family)